MEPGKELDRIVAEKVMGWVKPAMGSPYVVDHPEHGKLTFLTSEIPHYSTDIAAAWEVVGHLQQDKWVFRIQSPYCNDLNGRWTALFGFKHIDNDDFISSRNSGDGSDESAAHAICLAALRAVGVQA